MPRSTSVLTIGNFDGVHRGHRAILARARTLADQHDAQLVALTFDPHPAQVLRPGSQPPRITDLRLKQALLRQAGADTVGVLQPTVELLSQSPQAFIQSLVDQYRPVAIVEGPDFHFGKDRAGDIDVLDALGRSHGFASHIVPAQQVTLSDMHVVPVSSSIIRRLIGHGRVRDAAVALARPFTLTGRIVRGQQQARTLEIPTANLDPADYASCIVPADGVYAGHVLLDPPVTADDPPALNLDALANARPAAISVGVKPTFGTHQLTVEAHLLDFQGDLYGRTLSFSFEHWLRDQYKYPDLASLKHQLKRDLDTTRHWLGTRSLARLP